MGRDLLTAEEVKQLHHKTIIFPTIGYPIFRDNVLYNKFSCYKKGEIFREEKALEDLSYTYFTVEKLVNNIKKQKKVQENTEEINDFYEEIKKEFNDIISEINNIINNKKMNIDYPESNSILYCHLTIEDLISGYEKDSIIELSQDRYYIECLYENDKTIINIHLKY